MRIFQTEMDYLGFAVKEGELMIDPAKNLRNHGLATTLTTIKEVRSTLGLLDITAHGFRTSRKLRNQLTDSYRRSGIHVE